MIKTILAHLTGTPCDSSVLSTSLVAAQLYNAHVQATLVSPDPESLIRSAIQIDATNAMLLSDVLASMEEESKERSREAHAAFSAFCNDAIRSVNPNAAQGVTASWTELIGDAVERLGAEGRYHDLIVLTGGAERKGRLSTGQIGQIILSCGRPVLLASGAQQARPFDTIIVAWKDTPEAARAVTAAMPILKKAKRVEVVSANEGSAGALACVDCCEGIVGNLRQHGIETRMHFVIPGGRTAGDAILETAKEREGDLLVMGAYGHGRLREFIFGGVTRRILAGVDIPVFLFH